MSVVYFGRGKRLHIETNGGTLCGKPLPRGAVVLDECPDNGKFCRVCMAEVGEESLGSYLGIEALKEQFKKMLEDNNVSLLSMFAYQGPPSKNWLKTEGRYYEGWNDALNKILKLLKEAG